MSVDFSRTVSHHAAKPHKCDFCEGDIQPREEYLRYTGLYDGYFFDEKYHHACAKAIRAYCKDTDSDEYSVDEVNDWAYNKVCVNHQCSDCPYTIRTQCGRVKVEIGLGVE